MECLWKKIPEVKSFWKDNICVCTFIDAYRYIQDEREMRWRREEKEKEIENYNANIIKH